MTAIPRERNDAKVLGLSALGGALEFYDFVVFVFFTKTLGALFFPSDIPAWLAQLQVYGIFAAGYLVRPLGGVVMAHFGDRIGRKRMFSLSIFLMALPTLLIGLLPVYAQIGALAPVLLLGLRMLQGLAIGGEMPGAWVFVAEHAPASRMGFAVGSLSAGINVGTLTGSLMASWVVHAFAPADVLAWGWRIAFVAVACSASSRCGCGAGWRKPRCSRASANSRRCRRNCRSSACSRATPAAWRCRCWPRGRSPPASWW